ncbi:caspase family protein (plasmid) [Rhizobium leguminosarum]|uniref:caspase family protein n=1 Tax=Rhizobium leguminosarum TaxID=384 RepID=UPI001A9263B4|nr:caspase family protein [Rhizobium leguminosarum]MBY5555814.1 caspase family protein [Rhizobium leguminosarum]QSW26166.1 caspase family protein [Rhizobium leguminosarum]
MGEGHWVSLAVARRLNVQAARAICVLAVTSGFAFDRVLADDYMSPREPRRLALIVANDDYEFIGKLPGVKSDLKEMTKAFEALGFDVVKKYPNVATWDEFQYEVLKPFRTQVERDDLVVVYFSGHGFTYGGYQYFAPTGMPKQLTEGKVATTAIPVETLASAFQTEGAGGVVLIVDACRTIADFVVKDKDGNILLKGSNDGDLKATNINYVLALSVNAGLPSQGSSDPDKMSTYSETLYERLKEDKEFRNLHDDVEFAVSTKTDAKQVPVLYDHTWTDILLSRSTRWTALERELWESLLRTPARKDIGSFARRYTLSPYVREARRWLKDHPVEQQAAVAPVSPVGVDTAWTTKTTVRGLDTVIRFPKEVAKDMTSVINLDKLGIGVGVGPRELNQAQLEQFTEYVASQDQVVVDASEAIHRDPDLRSSTIKGKQDVLVVPAQEVISEKPREIEIFTTSKNDVGSSCQETIFGDLCTRLPEIGPRTIPLSVPDPTFKPRSWVKVIADNTVGWIPIDSETSSYSIDIGEPFEQVELPQRADAPRGLADLAPFQAAVAKLGERKLSWASIASPPAAEGSKEADLAELMTVNLEYALSEAGLDNGRVTIVRQDSAVKPGTLRLRLFTKGKD